MNNTELFINVKNINVENKHINYINNKLKEDLKETNNILVVKDTRIDNKDTIFTIETNFAFPITLTEYFINFINKRKRFILDNVKLGSKIKVVASSSYEGQDDIKELIGKEFIVISHWKQKHNADWNKGDIAIKNNNYIYMLNNKEYELI